MGAPEASSCLLSSISSASDIGGSGAASKAEPPPVMSAITISSGLKPRTKCSNRCAATSELASGHWMRGFDNFDFFAPAAEAVARHHQPGADLVRVDSLKALRQLRRALARANDDASPFGRWRQQLFQPCIGERSFDCNPVAAYEKITNTAASRLALQIEYQHIRQAAWAGCYQFGADSFVTRVVDVAIARRRVDKLDDKADVIAMVDLGLNGGIFSELHIHYSSKAPAKSLQLGQDRLYCSASAQKHYVLDHRDV